MTSKLIFNLAITLTHLNCNEMCVFFKFLNLPFFFNIINMHNRLEEKRRSLPT